MSTQAGLQHPPLVRGAGVSRGQLPTTLPASFMTVKDLGLHAQISGIFWRLYLVLRPNCSHSYQLGHGKCPTGAHHQNTSGAEHHARMQLCTTSHSISLYPLVMLPLCFQTEQFLIVSATRCPRSLPVPVPCTKPPPNSHSGTFSEGCTSHRRYEALPQAPMQLLTPGISTKTGPVYPAICIWQNCVCQWVIFFPST